MNDVEAERWVRDTLQEAGRRPPLPVSDLAIAKAAAQQEMLRLRDRRSRRGRQRHRRWLALAAVLLLMLLAVWWRQWFSTPASRPTVARVEVVAGTDSSFVVGRELVAGETIAPGQPLALRLAGGQSVRLSGESELQLLDSVHLHLAQGTVYVDSGAVDGVQGVQVETANGTVSEIGTQFEVGVGQATERLRVRVRQGEVVVDFEAGSHSVGAGEELILRTDGSVGRRTIDTYGASWQWVQQVAPRLSGQAHSLSEYLDWVGRETGYDIEFEDRELERSADSIEVYDLGSSLGELGPGQTLDVILPGSGLSYSLTDDGTLSIFKD